MDPPLWTPTDPPLPDYFVDWEQKRLEARKAKKEAAEKDGETGGLGSKGGGKGGGGGGAGKDATSASTGREAPMETDSSEDERNAAEVCDRPHPHPLPHTHRPMPTRHPRKTCSPCSSAPLPPPLRPPRETPTLALPLCPPCVPSLRALPACPSCTQAADPPDKDVADATSRGSGDAAVSAEQQMLNVRAEDINAARPSFLAV